MGWGFFIAGQAIGSIRRAGRKVPKASHEREIELRLQNKELEKKYLERKKRKRASKELLKQQQKSKTFRA